MRVLAIVAVALLAVSAVQGAWVPADEASAGGRSFGIDFTAITGAQLVDRDGDSQADSIDVLGTFDPTTSTERPDGTDGYPLACGTGWQMGLRMYDKSYDVNRYLDASMFTAANGYTPSNNYELDTPREYYVTPFDLAFEMQVTGAAGNVLNWCMSNDTHDRGYKADGKGSMAFIWAGLKLNQDGTQTFTASDSTNPNWGGELALSVSGLVGKVKVEIYGEPSRDQRVLTDNNGSWTFKVSDSTGPVSTTVYTYKDGTDYMWNHDGRPDGKASFYANQGMGNIYSYSETVYKWGDADLSGVVSFDDIMALYPNYDDSAVAPGALGWADGDFTGDGICNFDDIMAMYPYYDAEADAGAYSGSATVDVNTGVVTVTLDDSGSMVLKSASGKLIPANLTNIAWWPSAFPPPTKKSTQIGFADLSGATYTGTWAIGNIATLGLTVQPDNQYGDLTLTYGKVGAPSYTVDVLAVPEPATMALLAIGGVGALLRRRRA